MNCANHVDVPAVAFCRSCGKALCNACERTVQGTVYCEEHALAATGGASATAAGASPYASPYTSPVPPPMPNLSVSPGLAFMLGLIPGVGAIYNSQYAKGLIHVLVFVLLCMVSNNGGEVPPIAWVFIFMGWFAYMAFEAYHTARKRQLGEPVDEFSSILPLRGHGFPVAPVALIVLGVLFLLNNFHWLELRDVLRFWPVFLIALGAYMLWARLSAMRSENVREAANER